MDRIGDFAHFTRAHGRKCDCWVQVISHADQKPYPGNAYEGVVVAGSSQSWKIGDRAFVYDPPNESDPWKRNWVRYTIVPSSEVPDPVWAAIAKHALLGKTNERNG